MRELTLDVRIWCFTRYCTYSIVRSLVLQPGLNLVFLNSFILIEVISCSALNVSPVFEAGLKHLSNVGCALLQPWPLALWWSSTWKEDACSDQWGIVKWIFLPSSTKVNILLWKWAFTMNIPWFTVYASSRFFQRIAYLCTVLSWQKQAVALTGELVCSRFDDGAALASRLDMCTCALVTIHLIYVRWVHIILILKDCVNGVAISNVIATKLYARLHVRIRLVRDVRINPFTAETDFRRQNLTSLDVRFWFLKSVPALKE